MNKTKTVQTCLVCIPCTNNQKQCLEQAVEGKIRLVYATELTIQEKEQYLHNVEIIIGEPDMRTIQENPNLQWVQMTWAGTDKYTCHTGFPKRVRLTNASGAFGIVMSEYAIGAILTMYRRFPSYWQQQKEQCWKDAGSEDTLYGKTVLILGAGDIGTQTALRLEAFGTYNIGIRRDTTQVTAGCKECYTLDAIEQLLPKADIVIGCLPNKPQTRGLLNKERLNMLKPDALLLNMGRGSLVELEALSEVMQAGHLRGVILDVVETEPLAKGHPIWQQDRVMITPHIAGPSLGHSQVTQDKIVEICAQNLSHFIEDKPLRNEICVEEFEMGLE